jgi:hypothetical protein
MNINFDNIFTAEDFFNIIPTDIVENLAFRKELHSILENDEGLQDIFLSMCLQDPAIAFNTMFWTYDPRRPDGSQHQLFILRPKQIPVVRSIKEHIYNKRDLLVKKSRDEGATELFCKVIAFLISIVPDLYFLMGSKAEALVDDASIEIKDGVLVGPHKALFHKVLYTLSKYPPWLFKRCQIDKWTRKFKSLYNPFLNSTIEGEATTRTFGVQNRATAVFIDEFAQIEPPIAIDLKDNIHDVSDVCIYNSTHGPWGSGHPYAKLLTEGNIDIVELDWLENPEKIKGLYKSPDRDIIEIVDINYYRNKWPEVFNKIEANVQFKLSQLEPIFSLNKDIRFVADGGAGSFGQPRSPWLDHEILDRGRTKTYVARYIFQIPSASADQVFDNESLQLIKEKFIRDADYSGEVLFDSIKINEKLSIKNVKFTYGGSKSRLKWWGQLPNLRPDQNHNYIISVDISRGRGASNSVIQIIDINKREQVGEWCDPYIDVTDLAEQVLAICQWVGGASKLPFLIWEANGPGETFESRIRKYGYSKIYIRKSVGKRHNTTLDSYGWHSSSGRNGTKMIMLYQLDGALIESLKEVKKHNYIIIHSIWLLNELSDYCFGESREDANISTAVDESTGAKMSHGDRVIPIGMACIAMTEKKGSVESLAANPPFNSLAWRRRLHSDNIRKKDEWSDNKHKQGVAKWLS